MTTQILIAGRCKKVSVNGNFVVDYIVYHTGACANAALLTYSQFKV